MSYDNSFADLLKNARPQRSQDNQSAPTPPTGPQKSPEYYKEQYKIWKKCCEDKEYDKGLEYLKVAAEGGYAPALCDLAYQYFTGNLVDKDLDKAEKYARAGSEKGNVDCMLWLGQLLRLTGRKPEALEWFIKSGEGGQGWSAYLAGEMLEQGDGVPANKARAVQLYKLSAKSQNFHAADAKSALNRIGETVFEQGEYMEKVLSTQIEPGSTLQELYSEGRRWNHFHEPEQLAALIAAANNGHAQAAKDLSKIMVSDQAKSYGIYSKEAADHYLALAKEAFRRQADAGNAESMSDFAWLIKGENPSLAMEYLNRGAAMGNESCQLYLGMMLRERGEAAKALGWLEKAAEQGQGWAAFMAGEMYEKGEGTRVDISKAKYWYQRSVDSKNYYGRFAQEALDRLASQKGSGKSIWDLFRK